MGSILEYFKEIGLIFLSGYFLQYVLALPLFFSIRYLSKFLEKTILNPLLIQITKSINTIIELHKEISYNIDSLKSINSILNKTENINLLQNKLYRMRFLISILDYRNSREFSRVTTASLKWCIVILTDLRSDLATRLTEQRSVLESAKTEVEKNITGTPELLAVSEAQKLRLDRQIEQFEELQRVLVRV